MVKRGPSPWWLLLLLLVPPITLFAHFGGHNVLGWDSEPPLRPLQYLMQSLSAWKWSAYLGQPNAFQITQAPLALIYLGLSAPFGVAGAEKIVLTAIFALPAFTMYFAARRLFPNDRYLPFAAAWCYALCPLLFVRFYVPIVTVQLVYALLPPLVGVTLDLLRNGATRVNLLWLAGVELAFLPCANNLAYWLVPHVTAVLLAVLLHVTARHRPRRAGAFWLAIAVVVLINGFWLVPQAMYGLGAGSTFEHEAINHTYTAGVKKDVAQGAGLSYTLRMSSTAQAGAGDANGPYWTYARALENGVIAAPYFLWILLAGAALAMRPRDRRVAVLGVLLVFALYVMKGESSPFPFALDWFYRIPLLGTIFRNGYDKLLPMAAFAFALLLPVAAESIGHVLKRPRAARWALIGLVLLMAFPYWTGQMFMARPKGPTLSTTPPPAAFAFTHRLDALTSRVLFVPISDNPQLLATTWHFFGPNVYGSMTDAPFLAMAASIMDTPGSDHVLTALHRAIAERDVATFLQLARLARVGYVFVAHDMNGEYYGGESAADSDAFLADIPGARAVLTKGPYVLWRLPSAAIPLERGLVRRPIAGYDTSLGDAAMLAARCGAASYALVPLFDGSCGLHASPMAPNPADPGAIYPVSARVVGGILTLSRIDRGEVRSASVRLPAGTAVAQIGATMVGSAPQRLSLAPCAPYRVRTYHAGALQDVRVPLIFSGDDGAARIPLPVAGTGARLVRLVATRSGAAASAAVVDGVDARPVSAEAHLSYPSTALAFYALPGRAYDLQLGHDENFGDARAYIKGLQVQQLVASAQRIVTAPPGADGCATLPVAPAFTVAARRVAAGVAVVGGRLLIHVYDPNQPATQRIAPLPPGTTLAAINGDLVGANAHDEMLPTGGPIVIQGFRSSGPTQRVAFAHVGNSSDVTVLSVDRVAGSAAMKASDIDQWLHVQSPLHCPKLCRLNVRLSKLSGTFGIAVADDTTGTVIASLHGARSPDAALLLHDIPAKPMGIYVSSSGFPPPSPAPGATPAPSQSALQVAAVTVTPIVATGEVHLSLPRVRSALGTDADAILVNASNAAVPSLTRGRLVATNVPSALVLDTQFDPFWTTLIFRPGALLPYFPQHLVVDGFKNAWIVPPGLSGRVVCFYLSNVVALIGVAIAALTLLVLLVRVRGARRVTSA